MTFANRLRQIKHTSYFGLETQVLKTSINLGDVERNHTFIIWNDVSGRARQPRLMQAQEIWITNQNQYLRTSVRAQAVYCLPYTVYFLRWSYEWSAFIWLIWYEEQYFSSNIGKNFKVFLTEFYVNYLRRHRYHKNFHAFLQIQPS